MPCVKRCEIKNESMTKCLNDSMLLKVHQLHINSLADNRDFGGSLRRKLSLRSEIESGVIDGKRSAFTDVDYGTIQDRLNAGDVAILRRGVNRATAGIEHRKAAPSRSGT